jgi:hypothetical protein
MNREQILRKRGRLPGEIAFDRCLLPLAAFAVLSVAREWLDRFYRLTKPITEAQPDVEVSSPPWLVWLSFTLGLLYAFLWIRAVVTLIHAWNDPSSRILRFSAFVLLIPFAWIACELLLKPFHLDLP